MQSYTSNQKRTYIDLTHTLSPSISYFPGSKKLQIQAQTTIQKDGYNSLFLHIGNHHGTHIDAPSHFIANSRTLDQYEPQHFFGKGKVIDMSQSTNKIIQDLLSLKNIQYVFLWTGWDKYWQTNQYSDPFPVLNQEMANILISKQIKGVGIDALSIDSINSTSFQIHKMLLKQNIILIENLKNLGCLNDKQFDVACFPLKIQNSDGAPARIIASY